MDCLSSGIEWVQSCCCPSSHKKTFLCTGEKGYMGLVVPPMSLSYNSVKIMPISKETSLLNWTEEEQKDAYELQQKVLQIWEKRGVTNYMIYGKESPSSVFGLEIVPYDKKQITWDCLQVEYKLIFGGFSVSKKQRKKIEEEFSVLPELENRKIEEKTGYDKFCDTQVIQNQCIYEGKEIRVLHDYAPISLTKDGLHLLLVTKRHCVASSELTFSEFKEKFDLKQKLIKHFKEKGCTVVHNFEKNGWLQSVPHNHEHLVFGEKEPVTFLEKVGTVPKLAWRTRLPNLKERVEVLSKELFDVLKK